jgi:hypothetical protein
VLQRRVEMRLDRPSPAACAGDDDAQRTPVGRGPGFLGLQVVIELLVSTRTPGRSQWRRSGAQHQGGRRHASRDDPTRPRTDRTHLLMPPRAHTTRPPPVTQVARQCGLCGGWPLTCDIGGSYGDAWGSQRGGIPPAVCHLAPQAPTTVIRNHAHAGTVTDIRTRRADDEHPVTSREGGAWDREMRRREFGRCGCGVGEAER